MENLSYIYSLEYPEGNIRYIGKTNNLKKRYKGHLEKLGTSTHKVNWIKGLLSKGLKPIMNVVDEVGEDEWQFWESYYIGLFRSWGFDLTNLTYGGDGMSNISQEVRDKISKSVKKQFDNGFVVWNKGTKGIMGEWNKGLIRTEDHKQKISKTKKEYYKTNDVWNKGKKTGHIWNKDTKGLMPEPWNKGTKGIMKAWNKGVSCKEETINKLREVNPHNKSVLQFTTDGDFVKEWFSCAEAKRYYNVKGINVCASGKIRSSAGYIWIYKNEYEQDSSILNDRVEKNKNKSISKVPKGSSSSSSKKIVQIDPVTKEEIKVWGSITEARKELGKGNIGRACREGCKANGYYWRYL